MMPQKEVPLKSNKLFFLKKNFILPFVFLIKIYKNLISPLLPATCRYEPTCSQYALDALTKYGLFKGGLLTLKRISSCHPWGRSGSDPIP